MELLKSCVSIMSCFDYHLKGERCKIYDTTQIAQICQLTCKTDRFDSFVVIDIGLLDPGDNIFLVIVSALKIQAVVVRLLVKPNAYAPIAFSLS